VLLSDKNCHYLGQHSATETFIFYMAGYPLGI